MNAGYLYPPKLFTMIKLQNMLAIIVASTALPCCKSIQTVNEIPTAIYTVSSKECAALDSNSKQLPVQKSIKITVGETDGMISIKPVSQKLKPPELKTPSMQLLNIYRYTFDVDVLTMPFKIRPSVNGFPQQLDPNFSTAIYLGCRRDSYQIKSIDSKDFKKIKVNGVGYGYGGFIGIGAVTMNPFVTNQQINYEYDGFVLNGGFAAIYDAKKFNLGLALGADYLVDKNRKNWIYQGKPWFGVLFSINLN